MENTSLLNKKVQELEVKAILVADSVLAKTLELEKEDEQALSNILAHYQRNLLNLDETDDEKEEDDNDNITSIDALKNIIGYVVGAIFGRWDIRIGKNEVLVPKLPEPFDPLPICPPATLVSPNGLPATSGNIVSEEWLCARPDANT